MNTETRLYKNKLWVVELEALGGTKRNLMVIQNWKKILQETYINKYFHVPVSSCLSSE